MRSLPQGRPGWASGTGDRGQRLLPPAPKLNQSPERGDQGGKRSISAQMEPHWAVPSPAGQGGQDTASPSGTLAGIPSVASPAPAPTLTGSSPAPARALFPRPSQPPQPGQVPAPARKGGNGVRKDPCPQHLPLLPAPGASQPLLPGSAPPTAPLPWKVIALNSQPSRDNGGFTLRFREEAANPNSAGSFPRERQQGTTRRYPGWGAAPGAS